MSDGSMEAAAIDRLTNALTGGSETPPHKKLSVRKKKEPWRRQEGHETERPTHGSSEHFYILQDNSDGHSGDMVRVSLVKASDVTAEKLAKWRSHAAKNVVKVSRGAVFEALMELGQLELPEDWEEPGEDDE